MSSSTSGKQKWEAPRIVTLPRLTDLTLQTGSPPPPTDGTNGFSVTYGS